jgi:hypothetical protein
LATLALADRYLNRRCKPAEQKMRYVVAAATAAAVLVGGGAAASAQAAPNLVGDPNFQPAAVGVYFWGGHNYCWYNGWRGPGWYWCGYGARRGFGWGGGYGWRGWVHPGWRGGYGWRRGYAWHRGWAHPGWRYNHWRAVHRRWR